MEPKRIETPCPSCGREERGDGEASGHWYSPCPSDDCPSHEAKTPLLTHPTVSGWYWWLPKCFADQIRSPSHWQIIQVNVEHGVNTDKTGIFSGPIPCPAYSAKS